MGGLDHPAGGRGRRLTDLEMQDLTARRDPDGTARIRGIAAPDRTRNFFVTDIPFNTYNTERVDINRGANSFLFGLGSPAGLLNNALSKARCQDAGIRIFLS